MAVTRIWYSVEDGCWYCLAATDVANVPAAATTLDSVVATIEVGSKLVVIDGFVLMFWNGEAFV